MRSSSGRSQKRLLVLEDDAAIRKMNVQLLEAAGYLVDAGENGEFGWQAIRSKQYDLVVTDGQMPGLGGLELAARMRQAEIPVPVILVSGSLYLNDGASCGISAILRKPFHLYELVPTVQRILAQVEREGRFESRSEEDALVPPLP